MLTFKRNFILLLSLVGALILATPAMAAQVYINGSKLDVATASEAGTTLVPLRAIFETLGADVDWDGAKQTVTATKAQTTIKLQIGSKTAYKNGNEVALQVPGKIISGNTMVPLRFVSEGLGATVDWDGAAQTINIIPRGATPTQPPKVVQSTPAPAPAPTPAQPLQTRKYVGSTQSDKYHYTDCRHAKNIKPANQVWFKDANDAQSKGYKPCGVCSPPR